MPTNDFLQYGTDGAANVPSQATYLASLTRTKGAQIGIADPQIANKAWRQASFIASLVAQVISDNLAKDVLDDADFSGKLTDIKNALALAGAPVLLDKAVDYTAVLNDVGKLIRFTIDAKTLSLTAAATLGNGWHAIVRCAAGVSLTIDPNAAETVNGLATMKVRGNGVVLLICDGSNFRAFWLANSIERVDVASASTIDVRQDVIGTKSIRITGTTTITAVTQDNGAITDAVFGSALQLTNGASLIVPTGANITVAAGDVARMIGEPSSVTRVTLQRASGAPMGGGTLLRRTYLTASGTYTKPTDASFIEVECVGGGGGGGGVNGTSAACAAGGGGGGYAKKKILVSALGATESYSVGAGGAAGASSGGTGGTGGTSSFGTSPFLSAPGATGGQGSTSATAGQPGGTGGNPSTGDFNVQGGYGGAALGGTFAGMGGTAGGGLGFGGKGQPGDVGNTTGVDGQSYGGGGGGAVSSGGNRAGGAGAPGLVIISEWS